MKTILLAVAGMLAATSIHAADLGGGVSAGATAEAEWNFDTDQEKITLTPYAGYTGLGVNFVVETDLDLQDLANEELDLEWSMTAPIRDGNALAYFKVETDNDWKATDVRLGFSFSF